VTVVPLPSPPKPPTETRDADMPTTPPDESKADAAYDAIRARILDGTYSSGERLVVERLARRLDVSAVPIREAMRRLEAEGYVRIQRHYGATVAQLDTVGFAHTIATLAVLEGAAVGLSAPLLTDVDLAAATEANEAAADSVERLDEPAYTDSNLEFHRILYSRCPNTHLVAMIESEWTRIRGLRQAAFVFERSRGREAIEEHGALLTCIRLGGRIVEDMARAHRMCTADHVMAAHRRGQLSAVDADRGPER
jgi:DNA-binding GntR family transcriptional regulator